MAFTTHTSTLPLQAGTWIVDPAHSAVEFTVRHLGLAKVRGRFNRFSAELNVDDDLQTTSLSATVDLSSVDTNNDDRDQHLLSTDFFDADTHPEMVFKSVAITESGGSYEVLGDLTINGHTRPIVLDVEFYGSEVLPTDQSERAGFSATGKLSRKDFGIEFNVPLGGDKYMISDSVNVEIEVQFVAPSD